MIHTTIFIPTVEYIESLTIGSLVPDCFERMVPITEITYRGLDIHGVLFVCFYTQNGPNSRMSGSFKAGKAHLSVPMTGIYTSAAIWQAEQAYAEQVFKAAQGTAERGESQAN